jgi:hypothetical protein
MFTPAFSGYLIILTANRGDRLQYFDFRCQNHARPRKELGIGDFACNPVIAWPVFLDRVDAIWTWMILNLMRWYKPRFGMTMKRLANWCADYIRLSRRWCGPIGRDELLRRIFAK